MKMSRVLSLAVLFSMIAANSCSKFDRPSNENLVIAIEKAPMSLDPRLASDTFSDRICRLLYDGLLEVDDNFNYFPNLAESYSLRDDKTYIFKLRRGVTFHDGTPLTSADVKFTYESILDPSLTSPFKNAFQDVESIDTPDDSTVIIKLKKRFAPFRAAVRMGIVPKHIAEKAGKDFSRFALGTGIFRLKKNSGRDGLVLEKRAGYHFGDAKMPFVTFKPILDDTVRTLELKKGSVDLVLNAIPPSLLGEVRDDPNIATEVGEGVQYQYLGFNMEDPILKNIDVRKAIAHAINRDAIIQYKLGGYARKSTGLLAPINWAYSGDVVKYDYDPKKAAAILDKAGYKLKEGKEGKWRFGLVYKTSTNPEALEIAGVITENLKAVGINVTLRSLEFGVYFDDIKNGNFQIFTLSWTGITEPDHYYSIFNSASFPPDGVNRTRYRNKRMDSLTELARVTMDQAGQKRIYADIQRLASEDLPYVSLWHRDNIVNTRKNVHGFKLKANGDYYYLKDTYKE